MKRHGKNGVALVTGCEPVYSRLDAQIDDAVRLLAELRKLEGMKKLSASAFAETARADAGISEARLQRLAAKIERAAGTAATRAFVRRAAREFATASYPRPPLAHQVDKILRVYGEPAVQGEIAGLGITGHELLALACARSAEEHAGLFGSISSWDAHCIQLANLRDALVPLYAEMAHSWGAQDLVIERATETERQAGLQRLHFRRSPDLHPDMPDWPSMLVQRCVEARERRQAERREQKAVEKAEAKKAKKRDRAEARTSA